MPKHVSFLKLLTVHQPEAKDLTQFEHYVGPFGDDAKNTMITRVSGLTRKGKGASGKTY